MSKPSESESYAALEEIMRRAMDEAIALQLESPLSDESRGALQAYFNIIDWAKQQADLLDIEIVDKELKDFDPYSLLSNKAA